MDQIHPRVEDTALVSVVVPAYNAEAHLRATVESALAQTYSNIEVLLVDDGSTDTTAAVAASLAADDPRVRVLRQANRGVAAARNHGIRHANGTYVAPLDADDVWDPEKLAAQVRVMDQGGEQVGLVYSWTVDLDEDGLVCGASLPWRVEGDAYAAIYYRNFIGHASNPLFRRRALEVAGGYETRFRDAGGEGCEDWELALRIAREYEVRVAPGYLCGYRRSAGTMSTNCSSMARSYELLVKTAARNGPTLPTALRRWSRGDFLMYLAGVCLRGQDYGGSLRCMIQAVRIDPPLLSLPHVRRVLVKCLLKTVGRPIVGRIPRSSEALSSFVTRFRRPRNRIAPTSWQEAAQQNSSGLPWREDTLHGRLLIRRWQRVRSPEMSLRRFRGPAGRTMLGETESIDPHPVGRDGNAKPIDSPRHRFRDRIA